MRPPLIAALLLAASLTVRTLAHPVPDVPVHATFDAAGAGVVKVEFDLRLVDAEPETAPYFKNEFLAAKPPEWRREVMEKAAAFVSSNIEFLFEPGGAVRPVWTWEFTSLKGAPLAGAEDPVVLVGTWRAPSGARSYRLRSSASNKWSVLFLNNLRGKELDRTQVLFPGETSFALDLTPPVGASLPAAGEKAVAGSWWSRLRGS